MTHRTEDKPTDVPSLDAQLIAEASGLGLTKDELQRLCNAIRRRPSREEIAVCGALWSEHCSYKSSRVHLRRFHTKEPWVVQGPGENAGVYAVNEDWCVAFKMESHNHPSYIEPYQGAATGVGGILRDVFCMGARPFASLNCLRFGQGSWNAHLLRRVVEGIADYGNSVGVPTVCGDTQFHPLYSRNILVNAFTAGLVRRDQIFRGVLEEPAAAAAASAPKEQTNQQTTDGTARWQGRGLTKDDPLRAALLPDDGNVIIYFGSATGRDGVHGATMSSSEFSEGAASLKPTVQVGDPFAEKIILEATMALINSGAIIGLQDMGAAGLTSSSAEMAGRSGCGVAIDLSAVPLRVASGSLAAWEILLSESQERMLCAVKPEQLGRVLDILASFEIPHSVIGRVNRTGRFVCLYNDVICTDLPVDLLTDGAPVYEWPLTDRQDYLARWRHYVVPEAFRSDDGEHGGRTTLRLTAQGDKAAQQQQLHARIRNTDPTLGQLLADSPAFARMVEDTLKSPAFCGRQPLFQHYCATVGGQTVLADGAHATGAAAVVRLPDAAQETPGTTAQGVAVAGGCWERWVMIDPFHGAAHGTAAVARKLVATGALPRAMTDCLNFGSPKDPDVMRQIADAIDGINLVARELHIPVVSGNVSLNNQTDGRPIPPTPMIGVAGDHPDVRDALPARLGSAPKYRAAIHGATSGGMLDVVALIPNNLAHHVSYGLSEVALLWGGENVGPVPAFEPRLEEQLWRAITQLTKAFPVLTLSRSESLRSRDSNGGPSGDRVLHSVLCRPVGRGGLYLTALRMALDSACDFEPASQLLELPAQVALAEGQAGFVVAMTRVEGKSNRDLFESLQATLPGLKLLELGCLKLKQGVPVGTQQETQPSTPRPPVLCNLGGGVRLPALDDDASLGSYFGPTAVDPTDAIERGDNTPAARGG